MIIRQKFYIVDDKDFAEKKQYIQININEY
jgi:hypothetical protein